MPAAAKITADLLSRFNSALECKLDPSIFQKISSHFGVPSIDLFASRANHKLDTYVAGKPDTGEKYTDAFTRNWAQINNGFAFPPFCHVNRCLQKTVQENATLILVVPLRPTQVWFSRPLSPPSNRPSNEKCPNETSPGNNTFSEIEYNTNGMQSIQRYLLNTTFLLTLPPSSFNPGDQVLRNSTPYTSIDGPNFVTQGKLIQCYQL